MITGRGKYSLFLLKQLWTLNKYKAFRKELLSVKRF